MAATASVAVKRRARVKPTARVTRAAYPYDHAFYTAMALASVAAVFLGFAPSYYLRPASFGPLPVYLQVHGFVFSAWILLFVVQTTLVAAHRTSLHRTLGWVGTGWAALMVVVGITAGILSCQNIVASGQEDGARTFLTTPIFSMIVFAILIGVAVAQRRRPEVHKRLMLVATLSLLDAAVARWPFPSIVGTDLGHFAATDAFMGAAMLYDLATRGRIAPAYVWGTLLVVVSQWARPTLGATEAWHAIARLIIG